MHELMRPFPNTGRVVAVFGMIVLVLAVTASAVSAQTGIAIRISPPNFELQADPGQTVAQQIKVSNHGDAPLLVTMQLATFQPAGQGGGAVLAEDEQSEFGVASWTIVTPKEMLLQRGEEKAVAFVIQVPPNAPPGGQYLAILASVGTGTMVEGLMVGQRVGSLVLLEVSGEIVEQAQVAEFTAPALAAKGPINFAVVVRNSGNVHIRPAGGIAIKGTFGGEIVKLPLEQNNVLPKSSREFSTTWDAGWRMGRYTAEYTGVYGSKNSVMQQSASVIIFPWPIALPVLAVVALLAYLIIKSRKRIARSFKVLAVRE